jgi:hypothetical protein
LEGKTGYVETDNARMVRAYKSTYKRHGTLKLFAALEVATGAENGNHDTQKAGGIL